MASSQDLSWESCNAAGRAALQQGKYGEAEWLLSQGLRLAEQYGQYDGRVYESLKALIDYYCKRGEWHIAEKLLNRAIQIGTHILGGRHPELADLERKIANLHQDHNGGALFASW
jgi:pentatricopeptide repeat protein